MWLGIVENRWNVVDTSDKLFTVLRPAANCEDIKGSMGRGGTEIDKIVNDSGNNDSVDKDSCVGEKNDKGRLGSGIDNDWGGHDETKDDEDVDDVNIDVTDRKDDSCDIDDKWEDDTTGVSEDDADGSKDDTDNDVDSKRDAVGVTADGTDATYWLGAATSMVFWDVASGRKVVVSDDSFDPSRFGEWERYDVLFILVKRDMIEWEENGDDECVDCTAR